MDMDGLRVYDTGTHGGGGDDKVSKASSKTSGLQNQKSSSDRSAHIQEAILPTSSRLPYLSLYLYIAKARLLRC